jgi:hypothetical protein
MRFVIFCDDENDDDHSHQSAFGLTVTVSCHVTVTVTVTVIRSEVILTVNSLLAVQLSRTTASVKPLPGRMRGRYLLWHDEIL